MRPMDCPNSCGSTILKGNLNEHRKECPEEIVECLMSHVGCDEKFPRKNQKQHLEEKLIHPFSIFQDKFLEQKHHFEQEIQHLKNDHQQQIKTLTTELSPSSNKLKTKKKIILGYYAIGQSNKIYPGYRFLTSKEVLEHQYDLVNSHEKNGGFLALDDSLTAAYDVLATQNHWISITGDKDLKCGDEEFKGGDSVSKGTIVPLYSDPNNKPFKKDCLPLSFKLEKGIGKEGGFPSLFILI